MKKQYYAHVDGLRAVAVLSVLLFHLDVGWIRGGFIGVDVFLVISGFLITLLLKREFETTGRLHLGRFYVRRVKRIVPALLVVLAVSFLFSALIFSAAHLQTIAGSLLSAIFGVSNFYFWVEADYFDTSTKIKPLLHTWSLGVEEQFYLVWSAVLFVCYKLRLNRWLLVLIVLAALTSLLLNYKFADGDFWLISKYAPKLAVLIEDGKSTLFYLLPFRVYEFFIGALLAFFFHRRIANKSINDVLFVAGLSLVAYAGLFFHPEMLFPYFYGLVPAVGAALIIYSGGGARVSTLLTNKPMVYIGLISYSLYLVHWPIISFYHYLGGEEGLTLSKQVTITFLSFILTFLLYRYVETPMRRPNYFSADKVRLASALGAVILTAGLSLHAFEYQGWEWRAGESIVNFEELGDSREFHKKYYGGAGYSNYGPADGDDSKEPDVVVLGDSHGKHYAEGLFKVLAEPNGLTLYIASGTSCFHLPNFTRTTEGQNWDKNCPRRLATAKSYVDKASKPPLVIVSHSWNSQMGRADILDNQGARTGVKVTVDHLKQGILDLKEIIGDAHLVVIGNVPRAGANLYDVFTRPRPLMFSDFDPQDYLFRERHSGLEKTNSELKALAEQSGKFTFIDPFDYLCDGARCRNTDGQRRLIYSDEGHMSKYGSIFLVDAIKNELLHLLGT